MVALVIVSTFVVLLLGILVAGLLRSHADILRSLHELGVGVGDPSAAPAAVPVDLTTPVSAPALGAAIVLITDGMERLASVMDEVFSLSISEGAISNMLARAREPLLAAAATIRDARERVSVLEETVTRPRRRDRACAHCRRSRWSRTS